MLVGACAVPHPPILIPEVGREHLAQVSATVEGLERLARWAGELRPELIVLISPHGQMRRDAMGASRAPRSAGDFSAFGAPEVRLELPGDLEFTRLLWQAAPDRNVPLEDIADGLELYPLDWGVSVPLYYLLREVQAPPVVPLTFSLLDRDAHRSFGQAIATAAARYPGRVLFVASGDLSHRLKPGAPAGYEPRGSEFDARVMEALGEADFARLAAIPEELCECAGECGFRSLLTLGGVFADRRCAPTVLSYEGPFGVGYPVVSFELPPSDNSCVLLAQEAVEAFVREGQRLDVPNPLAQELSPPAAAFVSLHLAGQLRGCLGTVLPQQACLASEIIENAIGAATRDYRFSPVRPEELPLLAYSVDVLTPPEPVQGVWQLNPRDYGLVVRCGSRLGVLLPDIDGVRDARHQLELARQKAGIGPDEPVELARFRAVRHH